jgi:hypothetical protein
MTGVPCSAKQIDRSHERAADDIGGLSSSSRSQDGLGRRQGGINRLRRDRLADRLFVPMEEAQGCVAYGPLSLADIEALVRRKNMVSNEKLRGRSNDPIDGGITRHFINFVPPSPLKYPRRHE